MNEKQVLKADSDAAMDATQVAPGEAMAKPPMKDSMMKAKVATKKKKKFSSIQDLKDAAKSMMNKGK